jgi:hypothetical protein
LANLIPVFTIPKRVHNRALILPVTGGTEYFSWVIVAVVAVAVAAEFFFAIVFHVNFLFPRVFLAAKKSHD